MLQKECGLCKRKVEEKYPCPEAWEKGKGKRKIAHISK